MSRSIFITRSDDRSAMTNCEAVQLVAEMAVNGRINWVCCNLPAASKQRSTGEGLCLELASCSCWYYTSVGKVSLGLSYEAGSGGNSPFSVAGAATCGRDMETTWVVLIQLVGGNRWRGGTLFGVSVYPVRTIGPISAR